MAGGNQFVTARGDFSVGDLGIHVAIDSVLPDTQVFEFAKSKRVKSRKMRGVESHGILLTPQQCGVVVDYVGQDLSEILGITEYVNCTPNPGMSGDDEKCAHSIPIYPHIDRLYNMETEFGDDNYVIVTEKIHGANARFMHDGKRLWVGSRKRILKNGKNIWWDMAHANNLVNALRPYPFIVVYGEIYGKVQSLKYDIDGVKLAMFDAFNVDDCKYFNYIEMTRLANEIGVDTVPFVCCGAWRVVKEQIDQLSTGQSQIASHVREGIVIKTFSNKGRLVAKLHNKFFDTRRKHAREK